ncbi:hypothetical protein ACLOJK_005972 [Asimina triloba]
MHIQSATSRRTQRSCCTSHFKGAKYLAAYLRFAILLAFAAPQEGRQKRGWLVNLGLVAMACAAPTAFSTCCKSAAPRPIAALSKSFSQLSSPSIRKSFNGVGKFIQSSRSSINRSCTRASRRSFVVNASQLPLVGNKAPDFEAEAVFDQEFIKVKLSDYIGKKNVILFFYPLDFTFVCPTEITAFSDRYAEFEKINTEVLGVSVDSVFSHLAWVQTDRKSGGLGDLKYPLISDVTKSISESFGVLIPDQGIALRGLFIIDKGGVIQHSTINNLAIGRSVDETMRSLQALQYVQDNPDELHLCQRIFILLNANGDLILLVVISVNYWRLWVNLYMIGSGLDQSKADLERIQPGCGGRMRMGTTPKCSNFDATSLVLGSVCFEFDCIKKVAVIRSFPNSLAPGPWPLALQNAIALYSPHAGRHVICLTMVQILGLLAYDCLRFGRVKFPSP